MSIIDGVAAVENFWARVWGARAPEAVDELVHEDFVIVNAGSEIPAEPRSKPGWRAF
ncbi:hypothetical protein AB0M50_28120 [Nonomuraea fuscirosea]|uniref:hypothetical protein n=1 Tax=Nonomuraea fuscirosea TaxID=1291556 RepID=UPI003420A2CE